MQSKKDKDRGEFEKFKARFSKYSTEKLNSLLSFAGNKLASQAINIILKERGEKE